MNDLGIRPNERRRVNVQGLHLKNDFWLSEVTSIPCLKVYPPSQNASGEKLPPRGQAFYTAKVTSKQMSHVSNLIDRGFSIVEDSLSLITVPVSKGQSKTSRSPYPNLEYANPADLDQITAMAGTAFNHSRFHKDPNIPVHLATRIKQEWARALVLGTRGTGCLVERNGEQVAGFLGYALTPQPSPAVVIDLIAVDESSRRQGVASRLVDALVNLALDQSANVVVGTQQSNTPAIAFYIKKGFRVAGEGLTLHAHGLQGTPR